MRMINPKSHTRLPSDPGASIEDAIAIDQWSQILAAFDAVSAPFSPKNPKENYSPFKGIFRSGGEMVSIIAKHEVSRFSPLGVEGRLLEASDRILEMQRKHHKDPFKEAVSAACFSICQVFEDHVLGYIAGDCFMLWQDESGAIFYRTNFDAAAQTFEDEGNAEFARCKEIAIKDKSNSWDLYFDYFKQKQFFRANRNLGYGGHAVLNGDPEFLKCWTKVVISAETKPRWLVLGTDGLLPSDFRPQPKQIWDLGNRYIVGGINGVLAARDEVAELAHIRRGTHPEASAATCEFDY